MGGLEGLSEKIFLDRYARKAGDAGLVKPGDTVLALVKEDPKFPVKEVGEVLEREGERLSLRLRSGEEVESSLDRVTLPLENTPAEMWDRLAASLASCEGEHREQELWRERFRYLLDDWKLVPGGRIAAGAGASDELTLFNCYVLPSPVDSRGGIMKTLTDMTEIMARGGGVGINLSSLRPARAPVAGVNGSSSGSVSWGGLFSYTTGLIEQGGSRRGALMLMMHDWHPDVLSFIAVKETMGLITNANLSVCLSNAFMNAVKHDLEWELVFPDTKEEGYDELWSGDIGEWRKQGKRVVTYRKVRAREIWDRIIASAWKSAEPGVVFMERYNEMSNSWYFNPIVSTNPCFHGDTRIATEFGLLRVEELASRVGSRSFNIITDNRMIAEAMVVNGRLYEGNGVTIRRAKAFPTGKKKVCTVCLSNGMQLKVTSDHRLYTNNGWKEARQLTVQDEVYVQSGSGLFPSTDRLGSRWGMFLGWLTGDGWLSKRGDIGMVFGREDAEVIPHMVEAGKMLSGTTAKVFERKNGTKQVFWWRQAFRNQLIELGVKAVPAYRKEVPECIFFASKPTVTAYLQALFSADGTVYDKDEMHRTVRLTSASVKLLQDVQLLLLNYGIHGRIYERRKSNQQQFEYETSNGEQRVYKSHPSFELVISGNNIVVFHEQIGFRFVTRKQSALDRIARPSRKLEKFKSRVLKVEDKGEEVPVYDLTEPVTHSLIANGLVVHNCGEQGLPGWGVCNLSAVNLSRFYDEERHDVDWDELAKVTRWSVRFLDNVIDCTPYHFPENEANQKRERRIGLGTMGLAELMIKLRIRYGSPESLAFLDRLYGFMTKEAYLGSAELAEEKGAFPAFRAEEYLQSGFMKELAAAYPEVGEAIREKGMRNVTVITQAPTGSTGTMVGTSTGIEPYFAFQYYRQSRLGYDRQYVPIAAEWKEAHPGEELPDYFVTAMDLSAEDHIRTQAAIQRWVDSSISKTANCPADFTIEDTKRLYELAYELGCKGVTIYRDGSRDVQVLSTSEDKGGDAESALPSPSAKEEEASIADETLPDEILSMNETALAERSEPASNDKPYKKRPQVMRGATYKLNTPFGKAYITINDLDDAPAEIFLNVGKAGSDVFAMAEALGRVCSLFLRYGDHGHKVELLIKHLKGIGGTGAIGFGPKRVESIADAVAKALELHMEQLLEGRLASGQASVPAAERALSPLRDDDELAAAHEESGRDLCPSCGSAALLNTEGCKHCASCGYSRC
ncbi:ribonucleoside-diphosphate reductase [Paenibacillus sp. J5C_2022]|uniref:LAGLIDADG family homing endonuclease n=1 Tax=Paenibacillus sp. J5C2022 TaxID=2977129 RepID=UPI0021CE63CA|nr:LAGLIDADG family homing endonuclease [Paenibacillus sp. J5C2022]MCU6709516.1 ribonucleoside-diphosphate reductase [Paenibacillus sp. J5C2022]